MEWEPLGLPGSLEVSGLCPCALLSCLGAGLPSKNRSIHQLRATTNLPPDILMQKIFPGEHVWKPHRLMQFPPQFLKCLTYVHSPVKLSWPKHLVPASTWASTFIPSTPLGSSTAPFASRK
ncbi:uncharacterized protein LOC134471837 [Cavia porcellus]|uniref:uncharacterized protein LOC134471837 n=1 Tax=Cavia porcellus TaxID=10141 RepID=UPI002FE422F0